MLSKKTKYALHALTFLAKREENKPTLIALIAEQTKVPRKFLENILLELKKAGILSSKMGKGGGYFLRMEAKDISLSQLFRLFNGPIAHVTCASLNYYEACDECLDQDACGLHHVMIDLRDETLSLLENKSIADIVKKEK